MTDTTEAPDSPPTEEAEAGVVGVMIEEGAPDGNGDSAAALERERTDDDGAGASALIAEAPGHSEGSDEPGEPEPASDEPVGEEGSSAVVLPASTDVPTPVAEAPARPHSGVAMAWSGILLPRVQQILTRIFDPKERRRYERFFSAAAETIEALGHLDLTVTDDTDEPFADAESILAALPMEIPLALGHIDAFLRLVREEFPVAEDEADGADFDLDFGLSEQGASPSSEGAGPAPAAQGISRTLHAFAANLGHELRALHRALEAPTAGSDRWSIIEQIGEFRGHTRAGIGEMFFLSAREFAVVRQEDVVPFYKEDLRNSLALRHAITTMRARISVHRARFERLIQEDDIPALRACLTGFQGVFASFMDTEAFRALRVVDRRSCVELRRELESLLAQEAPRKRPMETAVEGLTGFIDSLTLVNQRELLIVHDREAVASTLSHLDVVHSAVVANDVVAARNAFGRAVATAWPLFGREPTFDGLLKLLRFVDHAQLELDDALALAGLIRRQL